MRFISVSAFLFSASLASVVFAANTHDVNGTIVSIDKVKHTVSMRMDDGQITTGPALGKSAIKALGKLKEGDKVVVTCKDDEKGEHLGATKIKVIGHETASIKKE